MIGGAAPFRKRLKRQKRDKPQIRPLGNAHTPSDVVHEILDAVSIGLECVRRLHRNQPELQAMGMRINGQRNAGGGVPLNIAQVILHALLPPS